MRLDGSERPLAESFDKYPARTFAIPAPKPVIERLRQTIALIESSPVEAVSPIEIPICGKRWWEDGTQYECLMDKGHRDQKHGLRGMVQRIED